MSFLVVVSDQHVRNRLVLMLSRRGTVVTASTLAQMRRVLERQRTIEVLITSRPLPDGDPLAVVRRFTRAKRLVDVPAAVIVPEIAECDAGDIAEIESAYAYVLDPSIIDDRLVPILVDRWQADYASFRRQLYQRPACSVQERLAEWRTRFDLTDFQCALIHAAAGGAGNRENVHTSHALAANAQRAIAELLMRTGFLTYSALIEQFVQEVLGYPKSQIGEMTPAPTDKQRVPRRPRKRSSSARPPRT